MIKITFILFCFTSFFFAQEGYQVTQQSHVHGGATYMIDTTSTLEIKYHVITVGQQIAGSASGNQYNTDFGIWAFYKKEPDAPIVSASDAGISESSGIDITFEMDPLSPPAHCGVCDANQVCYDLPINISSDELGGYADINQVREAKVAVTKTEGGISSSALANLYEDQMIPGDEYTWDQDVNQGVIYNFGVTVFNEYGISPEGFDAGFILANGFIDGIVRIPGSNPGDQGEGLEGVEIRVVRADGTNIGNSLLLDGIDDYLYVDNIYNDLLTNDKMSLEFWLKNPDNSSTETIINMGDLIQVTQLNNVLNVNFNGTSIESNSSGWDPNAWQHVAITKGDRGGCLQHAEDFIDTNQDGIWQYGEEYFDDNGNYFYDIEDIVPDIDSPAMCADSTMTWEPTWYSSGIHLYINGELNYSMPYDATLAAGNSLVVGNGYSGYIDDLRIWDHARTQDEIIRNKDRFLDPQPSNDPQGEEEGLIAYWKMNAGLFEKAYNMIQFPVPDSPYENHYYGNDLTIMGLSEDDNPWSDDCPNQYISTFTKETLFDLGQYQIVNIAYDISSNGTQFIITPYKENHNFFDPGFRSVWLRSGDYQKNGQNFIDNSLFAITGNVFYKDFMSCTIDSTEILIQYQGQQEFLSTNPPTYTDAEGYYRIDVDPDQTLAIKARYKNHVFPTTYSFYNIGNDEPNYDFEDYTTNTLYLNVSGGLCQDIDLGPYSINFSNACIDSLMPNVNGKVYSISNLPPLEYQVKIIPNNYEAPLSNNILLADLDSYDPDNPYIPINPPLPGQSGAALQYIHYPDLAVEIDSVYLRTIDTLYVDTTYTLIEPSCGDNYIFQQGKHYSTMFEVKEKYSYYDQSSEILYQSDCKLDTIKFNIADNITNHNMSEDMTIATGDDHVEYFFTARTPNLVDPYLQYIKIDVSDVNDEIGRTATQNLYGYVNGTIADPAQIGVNTSTSEIPLFILRDPPGDVSYSYLSEEQQICQSISLYNADDESYENSSTLSVGADFSCDVGVSIFGATFSTELDIDVTADVGAGFTASVSNTSSTESSLCMSVSNTYSTSDSEDFIYANGDVYVGSGLSMTFYPAFVQNTETNDLGECTVTQEQTHTYGVDGLVNTYMHTQSFIENTLIPQLDSQSNLDASYTEQANWWRYLVALNDSSKAISLPTTIGFGGPDSDITNSDNGSTVIDWSAGTIYEFSKTSETGINSVFEFEYSNETELSQDLGLDINGVGFGLGFAQIFSSSEGSSTSQEQIDTKTIGFVFSDNDAGDHFAVEIKEDPIWGMPVFELIGGQSECPWESGTVKRYSPILQASEQGDSAFADSVISIDEIEELDPAILTFKLANLSPSYEEKQYMFRLLNESNPLGVLVTYNGQPMTEPIEIGVEAPSGNPADSTSFIPGESIATVLVRKDSDIEEYNYEGLTFEMYPECSVGDPEQTDQVIVNVEFEKPCTNISLDAPLFDDEWSINNYNDSLHVRISDYEFADPFSSNTENLNDIYIQYAESGTSDWIQFPDAIVDINVIDPEDGYQLLYYNFYLDFSSIISASEEEVGGSNYKLRAVTNCGEFNQSSSNVLEGVIDRNPPEVFQIEPSDDVLSGQDEISLTYNEALDCNSIGFQNISTINLSTNTSYSNPAPTLNPTCLDNKITLTLDGTVAGYTVENDRIKVMVSGIKDVLGNLDTTTDPPGLVEWEFIYNQNPISWSQYSISEDIYIEEGIILSNTLNNIGGAPSDFTFGELLPIPDWLGIDPMSGWLNGQGNTEINFTLDPFMQIGHYNEIVYAENSNGLEPFEIDLNILCRPPEWEFDISQYQHNMQIVAELSVVDVISDDTYDRIAATIDGEIRGFVQLEEYDADKNLAYLTIYGNSEDQGKNISFRIWDNNYCRELWNIVPSEPTTYSDYQNYGSYNNPIQLNAADLSTAQFINLDSGWSWISFNLSNGDMSLDSTLSYLTPSSNDQFVDFNTSTFSEYSTSYNNGTWLGTLNTVNNQFMYQIYIAEADNLTVVGLEVDTGSNQISYVQGWNWIAYSPQITMEIDDALSNMSVNEIDFVKGRFGFAEYANVNIGWVGSLTHMHPGQGYMLKANTDGSFIYPDSISADFSRSNLVENDSSNMNSEVLELYSDFGFNPSEYQHTMSVIAEIDEENLFLEEDNIEDLYIIAYVGDEIRGVSSISSQYYDLINKNLIFSTIFSNSISEQVRITIYNKETNEEFSTNQEFTFGINEVLGSIDSPIVILNDAIIPGTYILSQNYPNPFNPVTHIDFYIPEDSHVDIVVYNIRGQEVTSLKSGLMQEGHGQVVWNGTNSIGIPVPSGIYFVNMRASNYEMTRKMMLLK